MRVRYVRLGILLPVCMATLATGGTFSWTGNGAHNDYDDCDTNQSIKY